MQYAEMFSIAKDLRFDTHQEVCQDDSGVQITLYRPSVLSSRFKTYDVNKNFQIFLRDGERHFRPNHLRVMIDLNLRVRSRPDLKRELLTIFDNIFYGKDPDKEIELLKGQKFQHYLNSLKIIANLSRLFLIEQVYGYHRESNFDPPTLFYQGWLRQVILSPKEIDNLCMSICSRQPPEARFVNKENKKNTRKYQAKLPALWYAEETVDKQKTIDE